MNYTSLLIIVVIVGATAYARADSLSSSPIWTFAAKGDVAQLREAISAGIKPDLIDAKGRTPLMHAAASARFGALKELLRLGADPDTKNPSGQTALDLVPESGPDSRACALLLRAASFFKQHGRAPAGPPSRPNLVLLFEPTVNYLHPAIKASYHVNTAERDGTPGEDDDRNGFIDDVHGWNLATDTPHAINPLQFQIYLQSRELLAELFQLHNDRRLGRISDSDFKKAVSGHRNPLAQVFGNGAGFTDGDFLEKAIDLAHGSHVAGIVLEHSRGIARLHTLSWQAFGDSKEILSSSELSSIAQDAPDVATFLARVRQRLLEQAVAKGRRLSDYVRSTGAGVVNMSMGFDYAAFATRAERLAFAYLRARGARIADDDMNDFKSFLGYAAFEFYVAHAVESLLPMVENPDVLFVVAAGNENQNNDASFYAPAYLSRFAANAITVGAVDAEGRAANFSNYGRLSVDIGAPGKNIMSTVIPEASVMMDGTSMSAPAVSGAAAWLRHRMPRLKASELKTLLVCTAKPRQGLAAYFASGAELDGQQLFALADADPVVQGEAYASAALSAALLDTAAYPGHLAEADALSRIATNLAPRSGNAWRARALFFNLKGDPASAVEPIERAVRLSPENFLAWMGRGIIHTNLGNTKEAVESFTRAVQAADISNEPAQTRADLSAKLAKAHLAHGNPGAARISAVAAKKLNPEVALSDDVEALLR